MGQLIYFIKKELNWKELSRINKNKAFAIIYAKHVIND